MLCAFYYSPTRSIIGYTKTRQYQRMFMMNQNYYRPRIWELDFLRGIAILLMVFFHLMFDLNHFFQVSVIYDSGIIYYIGKFSAVLFILIAGVSCSLSRNNLRRGIQLLILGLMITLVTNLTVPGLNIIFGILHFLGTSIIIYHFAPSLRPGWLYLLGVLTIVIGNTFYQITMPNNFLAPLGLMGNNFYSADYYPLFPWFGLFLMGTASGKLAYSTKRSLFHENPHNHWLEFLGRHSLVIYLVHQPILLLILYPIFKLF